MPGQMLESVDFRDTFLDAEHVISAFPNAAEIKFLDADGASTEAAAALPPFRLSFAPAQEVQYL